MSESTGADAVVRALEQHGVEIAFGIPGVHNLPLWRALSHSSVRLVGVRHEQAAAYAADGYARATGRLGVALVTTGPGAANTAGAIGEADASGSPVLLIATDVATRLRKPGVLRGILHETRDQAAIFAPIAKGTRTVATAEQLGDAVHEAATLAASAPASPVYLGIPTDLLAAPASDPRVPAPAGSPPPPDRADLDAALALMAAAANPLVWAGGGALRSGAEAATADLAERLCAPVLTTYTGCGLLPPNHPCAVPGPIHSPAVGRLWDEADLVIAIGSDFDGMMTQNWALPAPERLLAINVDPADASKNYAADATLSGDARQVLEVLLPAIEPRSGLDQLRARLQWIGEAVEAEILADEPRAAELLGAFDRVLPPDAVVVADMCIPGYWLAGYRRVPAPRKLSYPMGWGTLGFGFQAALGAALAGVGPAVCVCGDGGFLFGCGELATVAQERIPLTVVLVDDGGYGMLRFDQEVAGDQPFGVDLVTPDFCALAGAFGIEAAKVAGFGDEFERALAGAVASGEPSLLVVEARLKPPPTTSPRWYRRAR